MNRDFNKMVEIDVSAYTEEKNKLTYLSWANAWREFVKVYPDATYEIIKDEEGKAYFGNSEQGYMVYTKVMVGALVHEMWLPVMDFRNKSMLNPTTFDVNKAIMRCLTKNLAMFGLGLYIYAGEDLPEEAKKENIEKVDRLNEVKSEIKKHCDKKKINIKEFADEYKKNNNLTKLSDEDYDKMLEIAKNV